MGLVGGFRDDLEAQADLEEWARWLDRAEPVLSLLMERGCSFGEALIVMELNTLSSHVVDLRKSLYEEDSNEWE